MLCYVTTPAADIVWTNTAGGNWSEVANWSPNQAPSSNDTAWITNNGIYSVTLDANATLSGLMLGGTSGMQTLNNASSTLTLNGPGSSSTNGVCAFAGGTLTGTGSLVLAGPFNWTGGTIGSTASNIVVTANGGLAISNSTGKTLYATLVNGGPGSWSGSQVYCYGAALFSNAPAAAFDFTADGNAFYLWGGSPALVNAGTLRKTNGIGTTTISVSCTNTGSIQVNSGTLSFSGGGVTAGTGSFVVASGATLDFGLGTQTFNPGSSVTGAGTFSVSGAMLNENGTHGVATNLLSGGVWNVNSGSPVALEELTVSGGTLGCSNAVSVSGPMVWSGGTLSGNNPISANGGLAVIAGSGYKNLYTTLVNRGPGSWSGIYITCYGTALFSNAPAATFDFTADGSAFLLSSGSPALANAGTLRKTAGTGITTVGVPCTNSGSIQVNRGTLSFSAGGVTTSTGSFAVVSSATLDLNWGTQTFDPGSSVMGAGTFSVSGATLNESSTHNVVSNRLSSGVWNVSPGATAALGTFTMNGGTLSCSNAVNVSGPMVWSGGTISGNNQIGAHGGLTINGGQALYATLVNSASGSWSGAAINCQGTALFSNAPAATFDLAADGYPFYLAGGSPALANAGTLRKTAGTGTTIISVSCANSGSIQVNSGALRFDGGGLTTGTGSYTVAAGATLNLYRGTQRFDPGSSVTGAGTFSVSGATLNQHGAHNVAINLLSSGVWNLNSGGPVTLGTLTVSGDGTLGCSNAILVSGPMVWSGGTISGNNSLSANGGLTISNTSGKSLYATLVNGAAGFWSGSGISCYGTALFSNAPAATFDLTADGNALISGGSPCLVNAGTLRKSAGTGITSIYVSCTNTGSVQVNSGTLSFSGGGLTTGTGSFTVASGATLDLSAGAQTFNPGSSVTGAGTFSVSGATLNESGTHTVFSNLLSGGVWNVNPGGTAALGALTVSGNGTLGCSNWISVSGPMNWSGGTITGNNTISANGGLAIAAGSTEYLYATLVNNATGSRSGGSVVCRGTALFSNAPTATFDLTTDGTAFFLSSGSPCLANAGTLRKTAGTGTTTVSVACTNTGSIQVNSGTLSFSGGGLTTGTGSFTVASGATLDLSAGAQAFNLGSSVTGAGTFSVSGATLNECGTHTVFSNLLSGGAWNVNPGGTATLGALNLSGSGTLGCSNLITVSGPMIWSVGTITGNNTLNVNGGLAISGAGGKYLYSTVVNSGAGSWSGSPVYCYGTALFSNAPAATFDLTNDGAAFYLSGGSPWLANAGTLRKTAGAGTTTVSISCTNSGTARVNSGTLSFGGAFVQTGGQTLLSGGNLALQTAAQLRGGILSGGGTITGSVSNNATVSPGASPGLLSIVGNYTEGPNAHLAIALGGTTPGSGYDQLSVSGSAVLAGTLDLSYWNGFTPSPGNVFTTLVASARSGAFSALTGPTNNLATVYTATSVLIEPGNVPPTVQLSVNPVQIACRLFQVTASGTDPDGTVTNLTLLLDTNMVLSVPDASAHAIVSYDFPGSVTLTALATDNKGASGATNVVLTVGTLPLLTLDAIGFQTNRAFKLCMCGETGTNYQILVSDIVNTNHWSVLGTMETTNGIWRYSDTTATNSAHRFYRAQALP